jgi:NADH-quinone oxidoreductase subunit L
MAGEQSLDRMGGFRRALPFTFACFVVGGLALGGMPPFSGWLSKDDILAFLDHRGGGYLVLGVAGYVGALLTGIYTFRLIFRAFFGEPVPEARSFEEGHLAHAEAPFNPQTHELEDVDVGFPGPDHHVAERAWPMSVAMTALAFLAVVGGVLQIPGVDAGIQKFLSPVFADSHLTEPSTGASWTGLVIGAAVALTGIAIAYRIWIAAPGTAARLRERLVPVYTFLWHKWYFDELIDLLIVRPALWFGRFADSVLERVIVGGGITGGTVGLVRAGSAAVRRAQTGLVRSYAALMVIGVFGVALYFLISSS